MLSLHTLAGGWVGWACSAAAVVVVAAVAVVIVAAVAVTLELSSFKSAFFEDFGPPEGMLGP